MDTDPKDTEKAAQDFLKIKSCKVFQWQSQSPDLDPAEHQKDPETSSSWRRLQRRSGRAAVPNLFSATDRLNDMRYFHGPVRG